MSYVALQVLVGTALTDPAFRDSLLNGQRPNILRRFDLTDEERGVLMRIEADTLREFAAQLDSWLQMQGPDGSLCVRQGEPARVTPLALLYR